MTNVGSQKLFILSEVAPPPSFHVLERESGNKQTLIICRSHVCDKFPSQTHKVELWKCIRIIWMRYSIFIHITEALFSTLNDSMWSSDIQSASYSICGSRHLSGLDPLSSAVMTLGQFAFTLILACGASCIFLGTYDKDSVRHRLPDHLHLLLLVWLMHDVTGVAAVLAILHLTSRLCC